MKKHISTKIVEKYLENEHTIHHFMDNVVNFFKLDPKLNSSPLPVIHSIKYRMKDKEHLKEKIQRKLDQGREINENNFWSEITDFAGIRVLHLHQEQFKSIHNAIMSQIENGEWVFVEKPKAYTWDPEYQKQYDDLDIVHEIKDSYYTSVHYLVRPNNKINQHICCEIQVRTLFEEIWGEIDHSINYPTPTNCTACKEQIRVLSKLISTGTRLADSIFKVHQEFILENKKNKQKKSKHKIG